MLWVLIPTVDGLAQVHSLVRVALMWHFFVRWQARADRLARREDSLRNVRYQFPRFVMSAYQQQMRTARESLALSNEEQRLQYCPICCEQF
jgi:hypothetical protein